MPRFLSRLRVRMLTGFLLGMLVVGASASLWWQPEYWSGHTKFVFGPWGCRVIHRHVWEYFGFGGGSAADSAITLTCPAMV